MPDGVPKKHCGVAGLYVDSDYIYYSCTEELKEDNDGGKKVCLLQIYNIIDEELVEPNSTKFPIFIRGIGKDDAGNFYVLCSKPDSQVFKLNENFEIVQKSSNDYGEFLGEAYGMLVISEYVLVCANKEKYLCVLDLNLKLQHNLSLPFLPVGIARFQNKYFVTGIAVIAVCDIDLVEGKINVLYKESKPFTPMAKLRGICASDSYLYVVENDDDKSRGGRLLCLQLEERELKLVWEEKDFSGNCRSECSEISKKCRPTVVVYHNETLYYSQGCYGKMSHIVKVDLSQGAPFKSKMFDVE